MAQQRSATHSGGQHAGTAHSKQLEGPQDQHIAGQKAGATAKHVIGNAQLRQAGTNIRYWTGCCRRPRAASNKKPTAHDDKLTDHPSEGPRNERRSSHLAPGHNAPPHKRPPSPSCP